jgi:hypothetical protein
MKKVASGGWRVARWCALAVLCAVSALPVKAQFTLVSGTVTDPNGLPWACGSISATLINNNGVSATLNGVSFSGFTAPVKLGCPTDPTTSRTAGFFQMQLADNTVIKCGIATCATQTTWQFTVNTTGIAPPQGTGPQSFTQTFTISGSTQTLTFSGVPALSLSGGGGGLPAGGSVGQTVVNTAPGTGTWQNYNFSALAGSATKGQIPNTTVFTDQANTFGVFLNDFTTSTLRVPNSAGAAPTVTGNLALDSTNGRTGFGFGGGTFYHPFFASGLAITSGHCPTWSGTVGQLGDLACLTNPMTTAADIIIGGAAGVPTRLAGPNTLNGVAYFLNSVPSAGTAQSQTWSPSGIPFNAQTGTTYPFVGTCTPTPCTVDRGTLITASNAGAQTYTIPDPTTLGFANNFQTAIANIGAGLVTLQRTTTATINGGTSVIIPQGWYAYIYGDNTNWRVGVFPGLSVFPNTAANQALAFNSTTGVFSAVTVSGTPCTTTALSLQFNNAGAFGCLSNFTWASATGVLTANQLANSNDTIYGKRFTDTSPTGTWLHLQNNAATVDQYNFDVNGNAKFLTSVQTTNAAPACTAGTAGFWCASEGTDFTNVAGAAGINPNSTSHEFEAVTNGASTATPGLLVRRQPSPVLHTGLTAAQGTETLCAAAAGACNVAGQYHIHADFWGSGTACSSVTAGSVTFLLTWTDENAITHSAVALQFVAQTGAATTAVQGSFPFQTALANEFGSVDFTISTNGTVIQDATGYTACTTGTGTYNFRASATRLI